MKNYEIWDMHGHFLPGMDDGSKSVEESVAMLKLAKEQGISTVCATSHYYPVETVDAFLARREKSFQQLQKAIGGQELPQILLGAEVAYRQGIGNAEDIERLCIGQSRYLLLELPFTPWDNSMFRDIGNISNVRGMIPVIAHIERYVHMQKPEVLQKLLEQDVLIQMNASALLDWRTKGKAVRWLKNGTVQLLGSDCHNLTTRPPNLGQALAYLEKKQMYGILARIEQFTRQIAGD